jgi:hypothetical protein
MRRTGVNTLIVTWRLTGDEFLLTLIGDRDKGARYWADSPMIRVRPCKSALGGRRLIFSF